MKNAVLVHGFMGSALNWGPVLTHLRRAPELANWNFSAVDLLGHGGRRESPLGPYKQLTLDLVAEDLWLQCQDRAPFVALGHSFGLRPLLRLYGRHPAALCGLIVEDSSPIVDPANHAYIMKIMNDTPAPFATRNEAQHYFLQNYPGKLGAFLMSNIRQDPQSGLFDWRFDVVGLRALLDDSFRSPQWKEWESLSIPVKIIRGENSDFLSRDRVAEMQKRLPHPAEVLEIAKAGHWVHSDNVEDFSAGLIKMLSSWGD